ncbi:MAG: diaminopimelate epimerase [Spirochaetes bacterium]|jgi:diaminopimelate epimerase|nr:diaminopimelate epimerase [Spirochaetota bacterium]
MDFYKYHGLGNDYIVIDPKEFKVKLTPERIKLICHRNFGAGSDGILYGPLFKGKKISLKIFNPDGSEAEKSGNGIRIFSRFLVEAGYMKDKKFTLHTAGGEVKVELKKKDASLIRADMGTFTFTSDEIPVAGKRREVIDEPLSVNSAVYKVTCVSVGNPHCVIPLDEISGELARTAGPAIENHPQFPNRTNVQFMKVIDRNNIRIEIWERGAGYTLASGSSSCAAACAAYRLGLADSNITVHMPGGILNIEIDEKGHVHMTGPVASVISGNFTAEMLKILKKSSK